LTYEPTGAIVAAPTCSLPEGVGGIRNWDYRYTWIRDASFTLYGLLRIGFTDAAGRFMDWLNGRIHELNPDGSLQIMYGIDGRHELKEETLDHLEGYKGSRPVRSGTAPTISSSSIFTANCWTPSTCTTSMECRSPTTFGSA
jgi:GH15 family glucan-1,4-alpha-glucosidase